MGMDFDISQYFDSQTKRCNNKNSIQICNTCNNYYSVEFAIFFAADLPRDY